MDSKSITDFYETTVEEIRCEICDKYCKYPEEYHGDEGFEEMLKEHCENCPLGRL